MLHAALAAEDIKDWFTRMPWRPGHSPLRHHPAYEAYLLEQWSQGPFSPYWQQLGIYAAGYYETYSRAACVHLSSWYDPYAYTATQNYLGLKRAGRGPQRLILGPWTHGDRSRTWCGDVEFGPNSTLDSWAGDWRTYRARFFDSVLHGTPDSEPAVRLFVMGGGSGRRTPDGRLDHGGRWLEAADWPPPAARSHPLSPARGWRASTRRRPPQAPPHRLPVRPGAPRPHHRRQLQQPRPGRLLPAHKTRSKSPEFYGCTAPYLPLASRPDVLVFQTAPLTAPLAIAGPIEAELFVATDAPDTDFTAKLIDVYPPNQDYPGGYAMLLTDSIVRLRYAEDPAQTRLRTPGEVVRIRIRLSPVANLFQPGHRIRLDISSSNFPKFDVNPNTGEPEGQSRLRRVAVNQVFTDASRPSRLVLPVLPVQF